jgi:hypothetical protein
MSSNLVQYLPFKRDWARQDDIERRNSVGSYHYQQLILDSKYVSDLAFIELSLSWELESFHKSKLAGATENQKNLHREISTNSTHLFKN